MLNYGRILMLTGTYLPIRQTTVPQSTSRERERERERDRQTDRQTDRHADRESV